ncbi:hypothetical protein UlMin_005925 [Ulmus minor]
MKSLQLRQVPMLLIPTEKEHTWRIYNVLCNNFFEKNILVAHNKRFSGSSEGWLVTVEEDYTVNLYKPNFMNEEEKSNPNRIIHLPTLFLAHRIDCGLHINRATIVTVDPIENPYDLVVVVIYGEFHQLAFIKPAKDNMWIRVDVGEQVAFDEVVYYKDKFYAINVRGKIISFDVTNSSNLNINLVSGNRTRFGIGERRYLVKSEQEKLLIVERYSNIYDNGDCKVDEFEVFKLNLDQTRWVKITCLGNTSLFLGDNSSLSIVASNFKGCQDNCIYFTPDEATIVYGPHGPWDLGVYNLKSESFVWHYNIDLDVIAKMNRSPIWLVPTINTY